MDKLMDFLTPKAFNRISYVAVICWIIYGVILVAIFAQMENSDSFRCEAKLEKMDLVRGKCSDQYKKQYNKSGIPVYGFVIADFLLIGIVCVIYSQAVKTRVDQVEANRRRADAESHNRPKGRRLFVAYVCQLASRFSIGTAFTVLQTQVLYPDNFPSDFRCQIAGASHAANTSSTGNTQNSTMYQCHSQQATKKTSWMNGVVVGNGVLALIVLIEIICILALRLKKGREFFEDSQFLDYLTPQEPSQDAEVQPLQEPEGQPLQETEEQPLQETEEQPLQETEEQHVQETEEEHPEEHIEQQLKPIKFIENQKESIKKNTEKPPDLKALFQVPHGEGIRNVDRKIDHIYTKLLLIPNRAQYDFTGNREEQLKVYPVSEENLKPILREDIVDAENKKILIVGRPGIGKTLFLTKAIRDWALGKAFNTKSDFDLAFFLKFRKFNSEEKPLSLRELLSRSEYSHTESLSDEVWNYILDNPKKVLVLFDGLDEFSDISSIVNQQRVSSSAEQKMPFSALYYNIVEGNLLSGASVLTTTRPSAVSDVTHLPFLKTIEILGFASEEVEEYVQSFAKDAPENVPEAGKKIWEHIKTNMNIFSLCYIPANCQIICACLLQFLTFPSEDGLTGVLPTKLTEIYQRALKIFFLRHAEQYRDNPSRQEDIRSKDLSPEVEKKIKPLAKLAFDGLKQKRLIFGQKEVPENLVSSSLFHQLPDDRPDAFTREAQYCFIHLTMQEFLAAKHITDTMKGEELRRFVADHIDKGEWQLVLQFVGGLLGEQSIDIFTDLLPKTTEVKDENELMRDYSDEPRTVTCWPTDSEKHLAVTVMKCINESNESGSVVQSKLEEIGFNAVDFRKCRLAPADCTAVVRFLQSCPQISLINLFQNDIGSLGCVEIVKLFDNANCKLRSLNLGFNYIGVKGVEELAKALVNNNKLRSLNLSFNNIGDKGVEELAKALVNNNELRSLNLSNNNIGYKGVEELAKALVNNNKLRSLDLSINNIGDKGVEELAKALVNNNKLRSLTLSTNKIGVKGVEELAKALVNNNELRGLNLSHNNIGDKGVEELAKALVNNNELRSLDLSINNIGVKGVEELAKALVNKNKLRSLTLSTNNIGDKGVEELAKALVNNNELRSLYLSTNKIGDKGVEELAKALVNNNKLRSLNLSHNNIGDKGVEELVKALVNNNELRSLNLRGNNEITNEAKIQIQQAFPNCKVLV